MKKIIFILLSIISLSANSQTREGQILPYKNNDRFEVCGESYFYENGYLAYNNYFDSTFYKSFTISFWIKSDNSSRMYAFSIDSTLYHNNLNIEFNDGSGIYCYWNSAGNPYIIYGTSGDYTNNQWHHIVFTRKKGDYIKLYIDNVQRGSVSDTYSQIGNATNKIVLGNIIATINSPNSFKGSISDYIFIKNYVTSTQVDSLYDVPSKSTVTIPDTVMQNNYSIVKLKPNYTGLANIQTSLDNCNFTSMGIVAVTNRIEKNHYVTFKDTGSLYVKISQDEKICPSIRTTTKCILYEPSCYSWDTVTTNATFKGRDGAGSYILGDSMYIAGGWNPYNPRNTDGSLAFQGNSSSEVWKSTNGSTWAKIKAQDSTNLYWQRRHSFGSIVLRDSLWIVGGDLVTGYYQMNIWKSKNGANWIEVTDSIPIGKRVLHYTCAYDGKIYIMGGQKLPQFSIGTGGGDTAFYHDFWRSTDGIAWDSLGLAPWKPNGVICGSVVFNNKLYMIAGGVYETSFYQNKTYSSEVWSYNGTSWNLECTAPWTTRMYQSIAVWDNKIWVVAGYNNETGGNLKDVWFSEDGINWIEVKNSPFSSRHAATIIPKSDGLYMISGDCLESDVWKLTCE